MFCVQRRGLRGRLSLEHTRHADGAMGEWDMQRKPIAAVEGIDMHFLLAQNGEKHAGAAATFASPSPRGEVEGRPVRHCEPC